MRHVRVFRFCGDIDLSRRHRLAQELSEIERFGSNTVAIIDLTQVGYLDSTFVSEFLRLQRRLLLQQPGISVCIVSPNAIVDWLFEFTGIDASVPIFSDVKDAYTFRYAESSRVSIT